jgi:hypothetical protein
MSPKILFCGYGRAGKDEAAAFIGRITKLRYAGSFSWAALPHMAAVLGVHPMVAWDTRHQNREVWKRELDKFRQIDQCKLARMVLEQGEVAAGLRDKLEIDAVKAEGLFDHIIWVDRPGTPVDPTVTYGPEDCHETIVNPGPFLSVDPEDLERYHAKLFEWAVRRSLPLKRTPETEKLFRNSRFYCWGGAFEERYLGRKTFKVGDE